MGWPAKNDKTRNSRFHDLRIERYKTKFKVLKIYLAYQNDFLVPYNSKIIKSQISCFELATPFTYTTHLFFERMFLRFHK